MPTGCAIFIRPMQIPWKTALKGNGPRRIFMARAGGAFNGPSATITTGGRPLKRKFHSAGSIGKKMRRKYFAAAAGLPGQSIKETLTSWCLYNKPPSACYYYYCTLTRSPFFSVRRTVFFIKRATGNRHSATSQTARPLPGRPPLEKFSFFSRPLEDQMTRQQMATERKRKMSVPFFTFLPGNCPSLLHSPD